MPSLQQLYKSSTNKKVTYFSNHIAIILNLVNKGKKVN
jgi:hypothetical protein